MDDIGLWEINEAFAAQAASAQKELGIDPEKMNVNGGAVAIGHPLAATGARLMVDLMYEMDRRGESTGARRPASGAGRGSPSSFETRSRPDMKRAFSFGDKTIERAVERVNAVRRVAVIGAGTMGQGIAIDLLLKTDADIVLIDIQEEALERARTRLADRWERDVKEFRLRPEDAEAMERRTTFTTDYGTLVGCDIIWEVATESDERQEEDLLDHRGVDRPGVGRGDLLQHLVAHDGGARGALRDRRRSDASSSPFTGTSPSRRTG